jgi:hypothetical protein
MTVVKDHLPTVEAGPSHAVGTRNMLALCIAATLAVSWYSNTYVLTREMYHQLLGEQLEFARIDANFDMVLKYKTWGYFLSPFAVMARIALASLVLQLFFVLLMGELPFRLVARAVTLAFPTTIVTDLMRVIFLKTRDVDSLSLESVRVVPGSVSSLTMNMSDANTALYGLLSQFSIPEVCWCVIVVAAVVSDRPAVRNRAILGVAATWITMTIFSWAVTSYFSGIRS